MNPSAFRARSWLYRLSAIAVSTSLAGATAAVFSSLFRSPLYGLFTIGSTFLVAMIWVRLLRWQATLGSSAVRVGWLFSIPLAALNSVLTSLTMSVFLGQTSAQKLWAATWEALTVGALFWVPSLIFTLMFFGLPIAWAQRLAKAGLAGEERGEAVVGAISALIGAAALGLILSTKFGPITPAGELGQQLTYTTTALGAVLGLLALMISWSRENQRRRFVAAVEAGKVPKFRVDSTPEGKVLIRVVSQDNSYRVGDYQEEVAALTHEGDLVRPLGSTKP